MDSWKEASFIGLVSFFVCYKYPKDVPAVFVFNPVRMLVMLLSYFKYFILKAVIVLSNPKLCN